MVTEVEKRRRTELTRRNRQLASNWEKFGSIVQDYLGIPYKKGGRAVRKVTGKTAGVASVEKGLVCTSFVDVVYSRYALGSADRQLTSYDFGKTINIFDRYGQKLLHKRTNPGILETYGLDKNQVYGIVFFMEDASKTRNPDGDGRIHVGFLAFHDDSLFLIHASPPNVHIISWKQLLVKYGSNLAKYSPKGPKVVSIYVIRPK